MSWIPVRWERNEDFENLKNGPPSLHIDAMRSPFYEGVRYSVRERAQVLNIKGEWEWEPMPSDRDDAFYERCRFKTFEAAVAAAENKGTGWICKQ